MRLSKDFTLEEMLRSQIAEREGGQVLHEQMNPPEKVVTALKYHIQTTVQPARDYFGASINVSSGYRSPKVNVLSKGSITSQHCDGEATDQTLTSKVFDANPLAINNLKRIILSITDKKVRDDASATFFLFAYYCIYRNELDLDQVIHEFGKDGQPAWCHASSSLGKNKRQMLVIRSGGGGYINLALKEALMLGC